MRAKNGRRITIVDRQPERRLGERDAERVVEQAELAHGDEERQDRDRDREQQPEREERVERLAAPELEAASTNAASARQRHDDRRRDGGDQHAVAELAPERARRRGSRGSCRTPTGRAGRPGRSRSGRWCGSRRARRRRPARCTITPARARRTRRAERRPAPPAALRTPLIRAHRSSARPRRRGAGRSAGRRARTRSEITNTDHRDRAAVAELGALEAAVEPCRRPSCCEAPTGPPPVITQTRSNSCSEPMIDRNAEIRIVGPSSGSVT